MINCNVLETLNFNVDLERLAVARCAIEATRHKVEPLSRDLFRVFDSRSDKVKGWRKTHATACQFTRQLDAAGA
ncbi:hypothetical protein [Azotobacter armeniacus]